jgi:hypothetical protein
MSESGIKAGSESGWKTQESRWKRRREGVAAPAAGPEPAAGPAPAVALELPQPNRHELAIVTAHNECITMFNEWLEQGEYTPEERKVIRESHIPITKSFFTWAYCTDHGRHLVELRCWRDHMGGCDTTFVDGKVWMCRW